MAELEPLSWHLPGGTEEIMENPNQDSQRRWYSNQHLPDNRSVIT
jgi:hypothetical protein